MLYCFLHFINKLHINAFDFSWPQNYKKYDKIHNSEDKILQDYITHRRSRWFKKNRNCGVVSENGYFIHDHHFTSCGDLSNWIELFFFMCNAIFIVKSFEKCLLLKITTFFLVISDCLLTSVSFYKTLNRKSVKKNFALKILMLRKQNQFFTNNFYQQIISCTLKSYKTKQTFFIPVLKQ